MARSLSPQQARFVELYVAGPDDLRGNATRCYQVAYPTAHSKRAACESASRLLRRPQVRAYMGQLREIAAAESIAKLRNWMELAPDAQETLRKAGAGELRFPEAGRVEPELIRSAVRAATEILDRALGTTKHMHEHKLHGGIIVAVAGPPQVAPAKLENGDDDSWPDSLGNGSKGYLPPGETG